MRLAIDPTSVKLPATVLANERTSQPSSVDCSLEPCASKGAASSITVGTLEQIFDSTSARPLHMTDKGAGRGEERVERGEGREGEEEKDGRR
jgi:hypothetical protein